jgi:uncharacterized protein (UPF0276 family)
MTLPFLGFGLGLRTKHYAHIVKHRPKIDFFEIISENYMVAGGRPLHFLDQIREHYPMVMHGVSLSIGSADDLDAHYVGELKKLVARVNPHWVSDHLCWTGIGGKNAHDLLPLPYNEEALKHVVSKIRQFQDAVEKPFLIENVSSYLDYTHSTMTEWDFLANVVTEADCGILLDVNNIYVSSVNHGFDPMDYLRAIPKGRVAQIHMAGHSNKKTHLLDTHDHPVCEGVWNLYAEALQLFGPITTMIERDDRIPAFTVLEKELNRARTMSHDLFGSAKHAKASLEAHHGA